MSNLPWGPNGPEAKPYEVKPNPTAQSAAQQVGDAVSTVPIGSSTGGGGLGAVLANILISLILVVILWIPTVCLYPLTALTGIAAGFLSASVFARLLPADGGDVAGLLGVVVGVVVIAIMNRVEHRLAGNPLFRWVRHALRLVLLSFVAIPVIQLTLGATAPTTTTRYIFSVLTDPHQVTQFLSSPPLLGILMGVAVALHFLLWKGDRFRELWHGRLSWIGLK